VDRTRIASTLGIVLCFAAVAPLPAFAHEYYAARVPNPATAKNSAEVTRPCINCHNNPDGGSGCVGMDVYGAPDIPFCLNPFGMQFRSASYTWNAALAGMDADMDGFTNGQELQDPLGVWRPGQPAPGVPDYRTHPAVATDNPGLSDSDRDGYCYFGRDLDMDGDCTSPAETSVSAAIDCDDTMSAVNSGVAEVCTNALDNDCNGLAPRSDPACASVFDADGDAYCAMGRDTNRDGDCVDSGENDGSSDCDDTRPTVKPNGGENCADGIDNNCNMLIDLADPRCTGDGDDDMDGYCPIGQDLNGNGNCRDPGEVAGTSDCDDANPMVSPGLTETCGDGLDNDCDEAVDFSDTACSLLGDADGDGYCPGGRDLDGDGNCADPGEEGAGADCDDTNPARSPGLGELCTNTIDEDCDGAVSLADSDCVGYLDGDRDRYCFVGFDRNTDGDCADSGEESGSTDCNDAAAALNPAATEHCTDTVDNDCDGSIDAYDSTCSTRYLDFDRDGWCEIGPDTNGDGDCSDTAEQGGGTDAAPYDPTIYPSARENCLDRKDNDQDGAVDRADSDCVRDTDADMDGYCPIGRDLNADGDCLDTGENLAVSDCDDGRADLNPGSTEVCGNVKDDDCDGDVDLLDTGCFYLLDRDRDGFCGMGVDDTGDGDCLDLGEDRFGVDCDDTNAMITPRASESCEDTIDNDCDGQIDLADSQCLCGPTTNCDDADPCTTDRCTADMQDCEHVDDPFCGMPPPDMGVDAGVPDAGTPDAGTMTDAGMMPPPPPPAAEDDGCSAGGTSPRGAATPFAALAVLALLVLRRRRASR
jgi:MYXO-CTERM domain-containing protein